MATKLTLAEKIAKKPIEDFISLKGDDGRKELEKTVKTLKTGYKRRVASFKRRGLTSYAQISFERSIPNGKEQPIKNMTRNQLILEIARYQKFFNDETSSVSGINRVNRAQDLRIFGVGKVVAGKPIPARRMTDEERKKFWDVYDEFKHQKKAENTKYSSETIQQVTAEAFFLLDESERDKKSITDMNLIGILNDIERKLKEQQEEINMESVPNVYTGRGPFRA